MSSLISPYITVLVNTDYNLFNIQKSNLRLHPFIPAETLYPEWPKAKEDLAQSASQYHPFFPTDLTIRGKESIPFDTMYLLNVTPDHSIVILHQRLIIARRIIFFENRRFFKSLRKYDGSAVDRLLFDNLNSEIHHYENTTLDNRQHTIRDVINHYAGIIPCYN